MAILGEALIAAVMVVFQSGVSHDSNGDHHVKMLWRTP